MNAIKPQSTIKKTYSLLLGLLTWLTVFVQLYLTKESVFNFISYFTILSNILVAFCLTWPLVSPNSGLGKRFASVSTQSAIALYIFIVGLVYNLILRGIWVPTGWQLIIDNLLHVVVPIGYTLYWLVFVPKGSLHWRDGIKWIYFPLAYLIYTLTRGHVTNWYPYPFFNVIKFGYPQVFLNVGLMIVAFFPVGMLLILFNRLSKKKP